MILANCDFFSFHWLSSNDFRELTDLNNAKSNTTSLGKNTEVSLFTLRTKISNKIQKLWKKEWSDNTTKDAITRSFFPTPADAYLLKVCDCGTEEESIEHFLFMCCLFTAQRKPFKEACLKKERDYPPPLATVATSSAIWKALLKFIKESRRLDHKRAE
ncbi:hypothetical protein OUZ56_016389 [Daphnia magna]|uniref:Reverse transcriptase zinc-binding domain-containing protein n=1 Tax=Daphnia magna TaxID=35525 RepID=A0ABR0AQH4_9CRUS|nr:hypothetical protein OUZ56_016389 [Daphnia magna]